jgi:hypothetical protein
MNRWEFLIQKEGDRSWNAIREPIIKLEAGRYRLIAQSNRANLDVEIKIAYRAEDRIYSRKYNRRTNAQGLIALLPFTTFKPGDWELRCCCDIMSELLGEFWQDHLQIQVISQNPLLHREFFSDRPMTSALKSPANPYLQQLEHLLQQEIEPMLSSAEPKRIRSQISDVESIQNPKLVLSEANVSTIQNRNEEPEISELREDEKMPLISYQIADRDLQIFLEKDNLSRKKGESLAIAGRIATPSESSEHVNMLVLGRLLYELRNPHTGEICTSLIQSFSATTLPCDFCGRLEIPSQWDVALLIGAVVLETSAGLHVVREPFIVTMEIDEATTEGAIVRAICEDELPHTIDVMLAEEANTTPLHLNLPEPNRMTKKLQRSVSSSILPPKLAASETNTVPQLPSLPRPQIYNASEKNDADEETDDSVEDAFQALHLEERFLVRLNSLAVDAEEKKAIDLPKIPIH